MLRLGFQERRLNPSLEGAKIAQVMKHEAFHPQAESNFNRRGEALAQQVERVPLPEERQSEPGHVARRAPKHTIEAGDIIGTITKTKYHPATLRPLEMTLVNLERNESLHWNKNAFAGLQALVRSVGDSRPLRDRASRSFVQTTILKWLEERLWKNEQRTLSEFVLQQAQAAIKEHTIWVPIDYMSIESILRIGNLTLVPITSEMLSEWERRFREFAKGPREGPGLPREKEEELETHFAETRQRIQGLVAAQTQIVAERNLATTLALEQTEEVLGVLRILHPASLFPAPVCLCRPLGDFRAPGYEVWAEAGGTFLGRSGALQYPPDVWELSDERVRRWREESILEEILILLSEQSPTEFQQAVVTSLRLYTACALSHKPASKLFRIIIALESFIDPGFSGSITKSIGEAMAFFVGRNLAERKEIVKTVSRAYDLRSAYVHRGVEFSESKEFAKLMEVSWRFFVDLIQINTQVATTQEFFDSLTNAKYK